MLDGLTIPFAVERARRNPIRQAERDLVFGRGDDVVLAVQVYDEDGAALDLSGAEVTVSIVRDHYDPIAWRDYGLAWLTAPGVTVFQAQGAMLDASLGQVNVTIPREVTSSLFGRYGLVLSLDDQYGGAVLAQGVLHVRGGPVLPRLPAPGLVSIGNASIGVRYDNLTLPDGSDLVTETGESLLLFVPGQSFPRAATFPVSLALPAQRIVTVGWTAQPVSADLNAGYDATVAGQDFAALAGVVTFLPGQTVAQIVVPVRANDATRRRSRFQVQIVARNGAILATSTGTALIPGWVGLLDAIGLVDGATAAFVPGLIGVAG